MTSLPALLKRQAALKRDCDRLASELAVKVAELRLLDRDILQARSEVDRQTDRRTIMGFLKRVWGRDEYLQLPPGSSDNEPPVAGDEGAE